MTDDTVNVAFILKGEARSAGAKQEVESIARGLGMEPTRAGAATMTLKVSRQRFEELFGGRPQEVPALPASARDAGSPAGHRYEEEIPVPDALLRYVESISVEPPARRLDEP